MAFFRSRPRVILLAITLCIVTSCALLMLVPVWTNDQLLQRFAQHLFTYPLPPKTRLIHQSAVVGLFGSGNHCDFYARQTLVTELSRAEVEHYYQQVLLPGLEIPSEPSGTDHIKLSFTTMPTTSQFLQFTTQIAEVGYPAGLDWRCN
jgi:hypothetical protein